MSLKANSSKRKRYVDSGCSRHMTGKSLTAHGYPKSMVVLLHMGTTEMGEICVEGTKGNCFLHIHNVLQVAGLRHNLLSISQLCDKTHKLFLNLISSNHDIKTNKVLFIAYRKENVCIVDFYEIAKQNVKCFAY